MPDPETSVIPRSQFGTSLRRARLHAGLTQQELAQLTDTDQGQISNWERGSLVPRAETLARLRDVLPALPTPAARDLRPVQRASRYVRGPQFRPEAQVASMTPDGRELYVRRVEAGLSIRALAHKTGVDVSYLSMIENGHRNLSPQMRERLKAVLL